MLVYKKQRHVLHLLVAGLVWALPGCSGDLSQLLSVDRFLPPGSSVAAVAVTADSTTLTVGHQAQVSGTALDADGNPVAAVLTFSSLTPEIATVSETGLVAALASGELVFEGKVGGISSRGKIKVNGPETPGGPPGTVEPDADAVPANLASSDFENGSLAPFTNPWGTGVEVVADPTGSGRGNVTRFHYQAEIGDVNRALSFVHPRRWAEPMHFRGEFNIPVGDIRENEVLRKLVYWQPHSDYAKYSNGGLASGRTVVHTTGSDLIVDATFNPLPGSGRTSDDVRTWEIVATGLKENQWYTLEVFQQMESALGRADGILRVWLNGALVFEKNTMTWSDPAWVGNTSGGVPFEASDIYFENFLVGEQVNRNDGGFNEYRYWDNVAFSTKRISK